MCWSLQVGSGLIEYIGETDIKHGRKQVLHDFIAVVTSSLNDMLGLGGRILWWKICERLDVLTSDGTYFIGKTPY